MLDPSAPTVLAGDAGPDAPVGTQVATDSLQRTAFDPGLPNTNSSYPLAQGQPAAAGGLRKGVDYAPYPTDGLAAVTAFGGDLEGVDASSYGSWLFQIPEARPAAALDGDPETAWVTGSPGSAKDEWWEVRFRRPVPVSTLSVTLLEDGPWRPAVRALEVTTDNGTRTVAVSPTEQAQSISAEPGPTRSVRIKIAELSGETPQSAGAGLREVVIPGVLGRVSLALADPTPTTDPSAWVFRRLTANPRDPLRSDPENRLERTFPAASPDVGQLSATAQPVPGPALLDLLDKAQAAYGGVGDEPPFTLTASSTYSQLPNFRAANVLDGSPLTTWAPQPPVAGTMRAESSGADTLSRRRPGQVAPVPAVV